MKSRIYKQLRSITSNEIKAVWHLFSFDLVFNVSPPKKRKDQD